MAQCLLLTTAVTSQRSGRLDTAIIMKLVKTPCIGICSTTSFGDPVCRGCKRYLFEVINWNSYGEFEKGAVLKRLEKLEVQILENKLQIVNQALLIEGMSHCLLYAGCITFSPSAINKSRIFTLWGLWQSQIFQICQYRLLVK
jgi:predicted Fe-S protein YdhL (DUF1289 family)